MEIKITNFSQEYVICNRNGEEGICRNFGSRVKTKALSLVNKMNSHKVYKLHTHLFSITYMHRVCYLAYVINLEKQNITDQEVLSTC